MNNIEKFITHYINVSLYIELLQKTVCVCVYIYLKFIYVLFALCCLTVENCLYLQDYTVNLKITFFSQIGLSLFFCNRGRVNLRG